MLKKADAYGALNSYDVLKLIALAAMVTDHLGSYFWQDIFWLRSVGRVAFPLFLFLVGYSGNWKIKPDLLAWALAIILCGAITHHPVLPLDILVTIALTRCLMPYITRPAITAQYLVGVFAVSVAWFPLLLWTDYGSFAIVFAVSGWLCRQIPDSAYARNFLFAAVALHFLIQWDPHACSAVSTVLLCACGIITAMLLHGFCIREFASSSIPRPFRSGLQWIARNTLPIYALHVMLFMVLERTFFPDRLMQFQWF